MPAGPGYKLELLNLGRILQDPKCLDDFSPEDWIDPANRDLFVSLSTMPTRSQKLQAISNFLISCGVDPRWIDAGKSATEACTESQKFSAIESEFAEQALVLCEDMRTRRHMGNIDAVKASAMRLIETLNRAAK